MDEIKPCPICGTEVKLKWIAGCEKTTAKQIKHPYDGKRVWYIRCDCCGHDMTQQSKLTNKKGMEREKTALITRWNNEQL